MSTKNYEKGFEYKGFGFRRFLVEELRDSELGRRRYKLLKFIGKTRMERNLEIILGLSAKREWTGAPSIFS